MSRTKKAFIAAAAVALLLCGVFLTACQSYKWGPVGTTGGEVENNGTLAVRQGDYLYYVNGMDDVANIKEPKDNYFGKASVKGSIMKSKIGADGSLSETAVVVPKMFYSKYTGAGLYIYGDWIYYASPSTQTNNKQEVLTSNLEYMRTRTDGTKTQTLAILTGDSINYTVAPDALIFFNESKLTKIAFDDSKVNTKQVTVAENVTKALFTPGSAKVFYTKAAEDETLVSNELYLVEGNAAPVLLADHTTYASAERPTLAEQFTIAPLKYTAADNTLYYSKTAGDSAKTAGTYGITLSGGKFDKSAEKQFANKALTTFYPLGMEEGLLDTSAAETRVYRPMTGLTNVTTEPVTFSAAPTILFREDKWFYYVVGNTLMRIDYFASGEDKPMEQQISKDNLATTWLAPTRIGDYVYYINGNELNYLYRLDLRTYSLAEGALTLAEGKIVSGYEESDKTKDGLIPAFITEADAKTYISNHPAEKE